MTALRYMHLIDTNMVLYVETVLGPGAATYDPGPNAVLVPDGMSPNPGDRWDGSKLTAGVLPAPPKPYSLADVTGWIGYTPYNKANPDGFQTPDQVTATATAAMKPKLGAITSSGHTTTPITITTGGILVSGTTVTVSNVVDPVSGVQPGVGAWCQFRPAGAADFPVNVIVSAYCTAPGVVAIRVVPLGGLALGSMTLVGNIFWIW